MSYIKLNDSVLEPAIQLCAKITKLYVSLPRTDARGFVEVAITTESEKIRNEIEEALGSLLVLLAYHAEQKGD